jgi:YgiT-type zinc finger domain-containing protein
MVDVKKCFECGSAGLRKGTEHHTEKIGGQTFVAELPAVVCPKCSEALVSHETLGAFEHAVARHLAEHGPANGDTFRYMRKAVGIAAKDVAELLATTPETVSRWENGARDVDLWAWTTLGSIVLDELEGRTATRDRIREARTKKPAKTVPIDVGKDSAAE